MYLNALMDCTLNDNENTWKINYLIISLFTNAFDNFVKRVYDENYTKFSANEFFPHICIPFSPSWEHY